MLQDPLALAVSVPVIWLAMLRGGLYADRQPQQVMPPTLYIVGIILYFIFSIVARFAPDLSDIRQATCVEWIVALIMTLFMTNRHVLHKESLQGEHKQAVAKSILWKNRLLLIGFIVLIGFFAVFDTIRSAVVLLFQRIIGWIVWLMSLGGGEEEIAEPPPESAEPGFPPMELAEPARFWVILEQILKWIVLIGAAVAVVVLLFYIAKWTTRGVRKLYAWLMERLQLGDLAGADAGYEDEVERLADWKELRKQWTDQVKSWFEREPAQKWHQLPNNKERVRFLYRQAMAGLMRRGYQVRASLTPRETKADAQQWKGRGVLDAKLVELYEQVRYGEREPGDDEVAALKRKLEMEDE